MTIFDNMHWFWTMVAAIYTFGLVAYVTYGVVEFGGLLMKKLVRNIKRGS